MDGARRNQTSQPEEQSYRTLRNAFWRGQYTFLLDYGSNGRKMDARVHRLVAQAAGMEFLRYAVGDLRERTPYEQRLVQYRSLAPVCTTHYEAAARDWPEEDRYAQAQLADEWWAFKGTYDTFSSDSPLLRRLLPTHPEYQSRVSGEVLARQAEHFRKAVEKALEEGKQGQLLAPSTRQVIVGSLVAEFKVYARIGIPDAVFDGMIRDVPFLFDEGLPMTLFEKMSRIEEVRETFQWYLWVAIITKLPDEEEKREIEKQLGYLNKIITDRTRDFEIPAEYRSYFDDFVQRWQSMYPRFRDNRFVPYFKRALAPYRFHSICAKLEQYLKERRGNLEDEIARLAWQPSRDTKKEDKMPNIYKRQGRTTLIDIFVQYAAYDRPVGKPLPDKVFYQDAGTVNEYSVLAFVPGGSVSR